MLVAGHVGLLVYVPLEILGWLNSTLQGGRYRYRADQGDAEAQFKVGVAYVLGTGVSQDDAEALAWFLKAAEQGDAEAQFNIGGWYQTGEGVPKDVVEAYKWFTLARTSVGRLTAESKLDWTLELQRFTERRDEVAEKLTPEQRADAQRRAREWDAAHPPKPPSKEM